MADILEKFVGLGKMAGRVVRGAKPGNKNNPEAGVLHVITDSFSDNLEPQDILLQPEVAPATEIIIPSVTFTKGSEIITSTGATAFSGVAPGDRIRPGGFSGPLFRISKVESGSRVIISEPFTLLSEETSWVGSAQVLKVEFGRTSVFSYGHTEATPAFTYESKSDRWELVPGASTRRKGPHLLEARTPSLVRDGVHVVPIANSDQSAADLDILGTLTKTLPQVSVDSTSVLLSPVPYPSPLSGVGTNRFQLQARFPGQSAYNLLTEGKDYLLSYTNNPLYDGYRPLPSDATQANIHALKDFSVTQVAPEDFTGSMAITGVTQIWGDSIAVSSDGNLLLPNKEYMTDPTSGLVTFLESKGEDTLVAAVFTELPGASSGLIVKLAQVPLSEATLDSFTDAVSLLEGTHFTVNDNNGAIAFLGALPSEASTVMLRYLSKGATLSQSIITEDASDLRTDYFPVVPSTATLSALKTDGSAYGVLIEGIDYTLFYASGVIRLREGLAKQLKSVTVVYTPAVGVTCFIQVKSAAESLLRVVDIPVGSIDGKTFATGFSKSSFTLDRLVDHHGTSIDLSGVTYLGGGTCLLTAVHKPAATGGYAMATYSYTGSTLPYSPVVRIPRSLAAGVSSIPLDAPLALDGESLLKISEGTNKVEYVEVKSVVDINGLQSEVLLESPLTASYSVPSIKRSDTKITFYSLVAECSIACGAGTNTLQFNTSCDWLVPGSLLKLQGGISSTIVAVQSIAREGNSHTVGITPPLPGALSILSITATKGAVYQEGDSTLIPKQSPMPVAAPLIMLEYPGADIARFELSLEGDSLSITKKTETTEDDQSWDITRYTSVKSLFADVKNKLGLEASYFGDAAKVSTSCLEATPKGINPQQVPFCFKTYSSVVKNKTEVLNLGAGFIVKDGLIVLANPLKRGDRLALHGVSLGNSKVSGGSVVTISGHRFANTPKGTSFRVTMDYRDSTQHYLQGMTEASFLGEVTEPYLLDMKNAQKGPRTMGSRGVEELPVTMNAKGGITNSLVRLRDMWLSMGILWKISEYYKTRMGQFSVELDALAGSRIGNNDFSSTDMALNRMSTWWDVCHQATFAQSVFYPENWVENTPIEDGRFAETYFPYDPVLPYNDGGVGFTKGIYSKFKTGCRQMSVGDKVCFLGSTQLYTIVEFPDDDTVKFDRTIEEADGTVPTLTEGARYEGVPYKVIRSVYGEVSPMDSQGHSGFVAVSPVSKGSFAVTTSSTFKFSISTNRGVTWEQKTMVPSANAILTLQGVADWLLSGMSSYGVYVSLETRYQWSNLASEIGKTLSMTWPMQTPDVGGLTPSRKCLVLRGMFPNLWIRFSETGTVDLGFPKGHVYRSCTPTYYCIDAAKLEKDRKEKELGQIAKVLSDSSGDKKLSRASGSVKTSHLEFPSNSLASATAHKTPLAIAKDAAKRLQVEVDASPAVAKTYTEALTAEKEYLNLLGFVDEAVTSDNTENNAIKGDAFSTHVLDMRVEMLSVLKAAEEASLSFARGEAPSITLNASRTSESDPRVLVGDGSKTSTLPVGSAFSAVPTFPEYRPGSNTQGEYMKNPLGHWEAGSVGTSGMSASGSAIFVMDKAITLTAASAPFSVLMTLYGISVTPSGGNTTYIEYIANKTLADLVASLNNIPGVQATSVYEDSAVAYGRLTHATGVLQVSQDTPLDMYFGLKGDVLFRAVSDYNLLERRKILQNRVAKLTDSILWYGTRRQQLVTSFGQAGENLPANRQTWLNKLLQRNYGPAMVFYPLKKSVKEAYA